MNNKVSSLLARVTALALIASPLCTLQVHSQEVYSQIVGAIAIDVPKESDLVVAFPFKRSASFRGRVEGAPTTSSFSVAADSLTAAEFDAASGAAKYYVYVEDGTLKGRRFDIASNTASAVTIADGSLSGLADQDTVSIREHWTLAEAFPQGVGYVEETEAGLRQIELIVPETVSVGGGIAAKRIFYYYNDGWREVGKPLATAVDNSVLEPGAAFVLRNNSSENVRSYFFGEVVTAPLAIPVVSAAQVVDNFVSIERPLPIGLADLGLTGAFTSSTGTTTETRGDTLLVYNTDGTKISNDDIDEYYVYNGSWYSGATNTTVTGVEIQPGEGLAIRKKAGSDATAYWVNEWSLPQ